MKTYHFFLLFFLLCNCICVAQPAPLFDSLLLHFSDTIYFDSGSDKLLSESLQSINSFPSPDLPKDRLYLTGHTDDVGNASYNDALADRRAKNTQQLLIPRGWNDTNTLVRTFGERTPIAANNVEQGRQKNRRVTLDLYRATPFIRINGQAVNPEGKGIKRATVRLHGRTLADTLYSDDDGRFEVDLPVDSVVGIDIYAKNHFLSTQMIRITPLMKKELKIEVTPAEVGAVADIANLYFIGNQAVLLPQSEPELPKVKLFMEINPHLVVEIAGHVNVPNTPPIAEGNSSWDLSLRRAKMVYDYLIEENIPAEQLSYKPYGNHEMRFPNATSDRRQAANRRVEIRVIGTIPDHH